MSRSKLTGLNHASSDAIEGFGVKKERLQVLGKLTVDAILNCKKNTEIVEALWNNKSIKDNELAYVLMALAIERDKQALNVFLKKADNELTSAMQSIRKNL